eukprot:TRINITY_DN1474_c0_g1_i2.p1 TRINITY_DN1474_c0_g1~~TRINITY_DN1474_c0_g1_i2.p1  ORF type:complete len:175 (+),score=22.51 TRINITY_DN1474_c0_g1_i2:340-864(+)
MRRQRRWSRGVLWIVTIRTVQSKKSKTSSGRLVLPLGRGKSVGKEGQTKHTEREVDSLAWNLWILAGFNTTGEGFRIGGRKLTLKIGGVEGANKADVYVASLMDPTTNKLVIAFEDKMTGDGKDYTKSRIRNTTAQLIAEMISLQFVNTRDLPDHTPGEVYCVALWMSMQLRSS